MEVGVHVTKPGQLEDHILRSYVGLEDEGLELLTTILPPYNVENVAAICPRPGKQVLKGWRNKHAFATPSGWH